MQYHGVFLPLLILTTANNYATGASKYTVCNPNLDICEYWLSIEERLTMIHDSDLVYGHKGRLYKYHENWSNATYTVPPDEVIITDGFQRMVLALNNSVPGPPIIVYEGQTVGILITYFCSHKHTYTHIHTYIFIFGNWDNNGSLYFTVFNVLL